MNTEYFLYRLSSDGDGEIYGKFNSLSEAKLSASLLLIKDFCFILAGDMSKIYFYESESDYWEYDLLTDKGKLEFLDCYPDPNGYK